MSEIVLTTMPPSPEAIESAWRRVQLARHPQRPRTLDLVALIFDDFSELHGDRSFRDDPAIVGGPALLDGHAVMVIGHQKGKDTESNIFRNFGSPYPEGFRKAQRLMRLADKLGMPVITFLDTAGAFPGPAAEERGQAEAIASSIKLMTGLQVPIVVVIIGEGGSGGALAIGVGDEVLALENATYAVISPEGCAAILWRRRRHAHDRRRPARARDHRRGDRGARRGGPRRPCRHGGRGQACHSLSARAHQPARNRGTADDPLCSLAWRGADPRG
jgi:acetyl-CoA carboxylase carboxyl transferase alpha subunit